MGTAHNPLTLAKWRPAQGNQATILVSACLYCTEQVGIGSVMYDSAFVIFPNEHIVALLLKFISIQTKYVLCNECLLNRGWMFHVGFHNALRVNP